MSIGIAPTRQTPSTWAPPARAVGIGELSRAFTALIEVLACTDLDDRRRREVAPLLSAAAAELRRGLGYSPIPVSTTSPPVVREADLASAARLLLDDDRPVVDASAADRALEHARTITMAFR